MKVLKQVLGVDVAKDELVVSLGCFLEDFTKAITSYNVFENSSKGFLQLVKWLESERSNDVEVQVVMEATGVYHQRFACFLSESNIEVAVVLPNKVSNYARSLDIKTVTDKTSSQAICLFGLDRKLDKWEKPDDDYFSMQQLSREKNQIIEQRVMTMNQLHAEQHQSHPHVKSLERLKNRIAFLKSQEKEIEKEIRDIVKNNGKIKESVDLLCSIPGIGFTSAVSVLSETNGFELVRSKKQLVSYAGLDVKEKTSGTSVKGKPKISKRGNKHLRRTMYFPALTAIRTSPHFRAIFVRMISRHGIKMKAIVAVGRKLLELMYVIFRTKKPYDPEYEKNRANLKNEKYPILAGS